MNKAKVTQNSLDIISNKAANNNVALPKDDIEELKIANSNLKSKIKDLENTNSNLKKSNSALRSNNKKETKSIAELEANNKKLEQTISSLKGTNNKQKQQIDNYRIDLEKLTYDFSKSEYENTSLVDKINKNIHTQNSSRFDTAVNAVNIERSIMLSLYVRLENLLAKILMVLGSSFEYSAKTKKIQPQFGNIVKTLGQCCELDGKYKDVVLDILPTLKEIDGLIELRNNLAHGCVDIFLNEKSEIIIVFETVKIDSENSKIYKKPMLLTEFIAYKPILDEIINKVERVYINCVAK